ncbi:MAG: CapA family protein [Erysipelotrichaceae bacterium]
MFREIIKLSFTGDIMCEMEQNNARYSHASCVYDYSDILIDLKEYLKYSDYIVGNLETPIANKELEFSTHKWSFNTPIEFISVLKEARFNLLLTANNHCLDRGEKGLLNTINNLDRIGLKHIGTYRSRIERDMPFIEDIKGCKIAFINYKYGTNASFNKYYLNSKQKHYVNLLKKQETVITKYSVVKRFDKKYMEGRFRKFIDYNYLSRVIHDINIARDNGAEFTILCLHCGGQYNRNVDLYTKYLVDYFSGKVDSIICNHSHVVQKVVYEKKTIKAYSLGNFLTMSGVSIEPFDEMSEYSIILNIYLEKEKEGIKLDDLTFTITKSMKSDCGGSKVSLLFDLINRSKNISEQMKLKMDNKNIIDLVYGYQTSQGILKEYSLIKDE